MTLASSEQGLAVIGNIIMCPNVNLWETSDKAMLYLCTNDLVFRFFYHDVDEGTDVLL